VGLIVYIGGIQAQVQYAGSSGYPGVNQINVVIPQGVTPGCGVSITGVVGTVVSNTVSIPVASGGGVCTDVIHGVDGNALLSSATQSNYTSATLAVAQITTAKATSSFGSASFLKVTSQQYSLGYGIVSPGGCLVLDSSQAPATTSSYLNAGNITLTGPTGSLQMTPTTAGQIITYSATLPAGFFPVSGGSFTFQGAGGPDIGPFTVSVSDTSPLVWTNQSSIAAVNRSQGLTVNWTGGVPGTYVEIGGGTTTISASAQFLCFAPASAGTFTVPPYVLLALPPGSGSVLLLNQSLPQTFGASGLNQSYAVAETESSISIPFN
jgi:hypothetical protein